MSFVETEINGQIITIRLNRPERLNALSTVIRDGMADAFNRFHEVDSTSMVLKLVFIWSMYWIACCFYMMPSWTLNCSCAVCV